MNARATNPERVSDKVSECRFFLAQMAIYEAALDTEKFLYCLSAFLNSFRTITFRLYRVVKNKSGKNAVQNFQRQLQSHADVGFVMSQRDVEVHEDGAVVFQRFTVHPADPTSQVEGRFASRFISRWGWREGQGIVIRRAAGWQFEGNSKNLIELCHDAVEGIEAFIRQVLTTEPGGPPARATVG